MPQVSIVIPTHNGGHLLPACLDSVFGSDLGSTVDVIVVDNASSDNSRSVLACYDRVTVLRNDNNVGFAHACNRGASHVTSSDILIFLNNDTFSPNDWLTPLLMCFEVKDVSVVGAVLQYPDGAVQHAGVHFNAQGIPHNMRMISPSEEMAPYDVQAVTGACLAVRQSRFVEVGGFDTRYRNSFEDIDLCLKIRRKGGRIRLAPRARVTHLESQTPGRHDFDDLNRQLFLATWGDSVLPDVTRVQARAEGVHRVASVIPLSDGGPVRSGPRAGIPHHWEWIDGRSSGTVSGLPREMLERATGDYLVFLDISTYQCCDWPDLNRVPVAAEELFVAQSATGGPSGVLLSRLLLEAIGLPRTIDCHSLIAHVRRHADLHEITNGDSSASWRACRAILHHRSVPG